MREGGGEGNEVKQEKSGKNGRSGLWKTFADFA
jgi:hypothetical protein